MSTKTAERDAFDLSAFLEANRRSLIIGATAVVVAGGGLWFWRSSADLKATRAEQALVSAERSFYSGNAALAESELLRVVNRYGGTQAGVRAQMLLAQSLYQQGRHEQGVSGLREVVGAGTAKPYRAAIHALIAAGLEDLGKFDEAALAYADASKAAVNSLERDSFKADQARVLQGSGKADQALAIWQELASDDNSPLAGEAKLRVGELGTKAASRS
jgi:predicted negative regulator of RcsB-dependent stress response